MKIQKDGRIIHVTKKAFEVVYKPRGYVEVDEVKSLADLTKAELLELCGEAGIEVNARATKAEIIALLEGK